MDKTTKEENKFISTKAIFNCGINVAKVMAIAYASNSPADKLSSIQPIVKLENLTDEAKIKFIADILSRAKTERFSIAKKLNKLIQNVENNN